MRVLVSACIMGDRCKYNGQSNRNELAIEYLRDKDVVKICPEMLAGMGIPRPCAEIVEGIVMDEHGENVDDTYRRAVELALKTIENQPFDLVILQSRSPTCGVNEVMTAHSPAVWFPARDCSPKHSRMRDIESSTLVIWRAFRSKRDWRTATGQDGETLQDVANKRRPVGKKPT